MTGFGILGHLQNLAATQKAAVSFKLHTLPSRCPSEISSCAEYAHPIIDMVETQTTSIDRFQQKQSL